MSNLKFSQLPQTPSLLGNAIFPIVENGNNYTVTPLTIQDFVLANAYSNANAAAYIPTDSTITGIQTSISNTNSNVATLTTSTNTSIARINSNVANTNSNVTSLTGAVTSLSGITYSNANVAAYMPSYLPTYTGNLAGGNLSITGQIQAIGNITGSYIIGDGSKLTNINGANIIGNIANVVYAQTAGSANTAITVTGNVQAIQITGTVANAYNSVFADTANAVAGSNVVGAVASATGALTAATVTANAQPNITSVGLLYGASVFGAVFVTGGPVSVTGNVQGNYIKGDGSQLSNINAANISNAYGNSNVAAYLPTYTGSLNASSITSTGLITAVNFSSIGTTYANNVFTSAYIRSDGFISSAGNIIGAHFIGNGSQLTNINGANIVGNVANVTYAQSAGSANTAITVTGNVQASQIVGNIVAQSAVTLTGNIVGSQVSGQVQLAYQSQFATDATSAVAVLGAAQPNIISLGTLTGLSVSGGVSLAGNIVTANAINIGLLAGATGQTGNGIAIGVRAGESLQGNIAIALGQNAGQSSQATSAIAIGPFAGRYNQQANAVAIGRGAGNTDQSIASIAVGQGAANQSQGGQAIAIGLSAGRLDQGGNAIAIGAYAGYSAQGNNSIVINATGTSLMGNVANTFNVMPVRSVTGVAATPAITPPAGFYFAAYNPTTGEFIYFN